MCLSRRQLSRYRSAGQSARVDLFRSRKVGLSRRGDHRVMSNHRCDSDRNNGFGETEKALPDDIGIWKKGLHLTDVEQADWSQELIHLILGGSMNQPPHAGEPGNASEHSCRQIVNKRRKQMWFYEEPLVWRLYVIARCHTPDLVCK